MALCRGPPSRSAFRAGWTLFLLKRAIYCCCVVKASNGGKIPIEATFPKDREFISHEDGTLGWVCTDCTHRISVHPASDIARTENLLKQPYYHQDAVTHATPKSVRSEFRKNFFCCCVCNDLKEVSIGLTSVPHTYRAPPGAGARCR